MTISPEDEFIKIIKKYSYKMEPEGAEKKAQLFPLKNIKAVLFDIYGTLFISEAGDISHADSSSATNSVFIETFREAGIDTSDFNKGIIANLRDVYITEIKNEHKKLMDNGIKYPEVVITEIWRNIVKQLTDRKFSDKEIQITALVYDLFQTEHIPMPGAEKTIAFLNSRQIVTGLISNAQFYTPLLFNAYFSRETDMPLFDSELSIFSYMYRRGKPDPFLFRKAAGILDKKI